MYMPSETVVRRDVIIFWRRYVLLWIRRSRITVTVTRRWYLRGPLGCMLILRSSLLRIILIRRLFSRMWVRDRRTSNFIMRFWTGSIRPSVGNRTRCLCSTATATTTILLRLRSLRIWWSGCRSWGVIGGSARGGRVGTIEGGSIWVVGIVRRK